jgi:hypothetical protein
MADESKLFVRMINHGQSEIWLGMEETETSTRRVLASNEVRNVVQRLCPATFEAFYRDLHAKPGQVVSLEGSNLGEVAKEWKLT